MRDLFGVEIDELDLADLDSVRAGQDRGRDLLLDDGLPQRQIGPPVA